MKEKITFPTLVANLAIRSGKSKKQCEDFLRELFSTIEQTLASGESLKIKNLGTFKIVKVEARKSVDVNTGESIEIPSHNKVTFIPAKELSEDINAPFSMFETVEIADQSLSDYEITDKEIDHPINPQTAEENPVNVQPDSSSKSSEDTQNESSSEEIPNTEENVYSINEDSDETELKETYNTEDTEQIDQNIDEELTQYEYTQEKPKKLRFLWGFLSGIACSALIIVATLLIIYKDCDKIFEIFNRGIEQPASSEPANASDEMGISKIDEKSVSDVSQDSAKSEEMSENMVPTQASDKIIYDTITRTRYLTTMAKDHYGNYNLWPYIYIENQKILGHPDRIKPGTKVVVPPLSKYKVDPNSKKEIDKAKQMGLDIYARYQ